MDGIRGALRGVTAALSARDGWASLPAPDLPPSSIAALQRRHGTPVPLAAIYAANSMRRADAERMLAEQRVAEVRRRVRAKARMREEARRDRWADEWAVGHGDR